MTAEGEPVLLTRAAAAKALSMSLKTFQRHVQPHIRLVRVGALRLVRPADLERFAELRQDR